MSKTAEEYSKEFDAMYGDHMPDLPTSKVEEAALEAYPKDILPIEASFTLRFRCETARDILCAILSTKTTAGDSDIDIAIEITDELIRKLKETENNRPQT